MKYLTSLVIFLIISANIALAQETPLDSLSEEVQSVFHAREYRTSTNFKTIDQLHRWFLFQEKSLQNSHPNSRVLLKGIYSAQYMGPRMFRPNWVFSYENQTPLMTHNISASIFSVKLGEKVTSNLRVRFGQGYTNIGGLNDRAQSNFGITLRLSFYKNKIINPMFGLDYNYVNMKKTSNGDALFPWAGNSFYIFRNFSFDVKIGRAFWSGFNSSRPNSNWFGMGAISYHQTPILTKAGKPFLGGLETTMWYNLELESIKSNIGLPIRLFSEMSLMPYFSIGSGLRDMKANTRITLQKSLGMELRMFGDYLKKFPNMNPYISADYNTLQLNTESRSGAGWAFLIGNRMRIRNRIDFDINTGLAFWKKDFPGGDKNKPDFWMINFGFNYRWGAPRRDPRYIRGEIYTYKSLWGKSDLGIKDGKIDILPSNVIADQVSEVRVFAIEKKPKEKKRLFIPKRDFGDVSDLKFFSINLDMKILVDPLNDKNNLLDKVNSNDKDILIAVLFNRKKVKTDNIDPSNMLFHFEDIQNGQYFGYRWDKNRLRVPEYRHYENLGIINGTPYMGAYDEFVKPLKWLDSDEVLGIPGNFIERKILKIMDKNTPNLNETNISVGPTVGPLQTFEENYRIAVVRYKLSTIKKMRRYLGDRDFAVAIKFQKDMDGDGVYTYLKDASIIENENQFSNLNPDSTIVGYDDDDVFFFSNHVKSKNIKYLNKIKAGAVLKNIAIYGFGLCKADIPKKERRKINEKILPLLKRNKNIQVDLVGYADATPLREKCERKYGEKRGQYELSLARAESVKEYLIKNGIAPKRIVIRGAGVYDPNSIRQPKHRRVEIILLKTK